MFPCKMGICGSDYCIILQCLEIEADSGFLQVMNLRQENENVMDTLVRTKVELAETQGACLLPLYCLPCPITVHPLGLQMESENFNEML